MKKKILCILLLILCILNGCGAQEDVEYKQKDLAKPDVIMIGGGSDAKIITYENEPEKYNEIYEAINENWWKYTAAEDEIVPDEDLIDVPNVGDLRTTSDVYYLENDTQSMTFVYEAQSMVWTRSSVQEFEVSELFFVLPKDAEEGKNVKSFYQVRTKDEKVPWEGIFAYFCSDELYHALSETGQTVTSIYEEKPTEIGIDHFSDITTEEMYDYIFENNGWTRLIDHRVYWNPLLKQVTISNVFSEKASEEQLENARDYKNTVERYRNYTNPTTSIDSMWKRIPKDADVIIQVYVEDELMSQDIYENYENGLFYKETHYEK